MASQEMYALGSQSSVIRELFTYGQQQAAIVGRENVFDFSIGNPTVPAPACIREAIEEILATRESAAIHGYTAASGDEAVRQGLAAYMNETYDAGVTAGNFYMTCGAAASLTITLKALVEGPADEIVLLAPFFPEYTVFVGNAGAKVVVVPPDVEQFQVSLNALEQAMTAHTRAVIVNSPNNPSGTVYSAETYEKVAALLGRKSAEIGHPIYLIADEPYREIIYDGLPILYVPKFYSNTIICYSYSKSLSLPGERIGYILIPGCAAASREVYTAVCGAGRAMGFVCAPHLFQDVVLKCLGQTSDVGVYDFNRKLLYNELSQMGYECVYPSGAFYLFVKSPEAAAAAFVEKAKKLNLLIVPADSFGCPGYVRISYCVDPDMIKRSFGAFRKLIEQYV
ncbi:pyridoxal phosphate-dependent aminotransferase [Megasphaera cerevisiae]|uniref:pyridoxal phosphate-dependent aminotransferase n=1 Tax=Megasphaera cerevisiae TaxID=39029 RepID=UPI00094481C4|nr:pyridoxal phosphate-dependent aminotransferase [Megasphaera cerevisiae]OKY53458.1 aspartate aminotransferase [Megasphaera cerevisiae]